jgi:hypothetical protein
LPSIRASSRIRHQRRDHSLSSSRRCRDRQQGARLELAVESRTYDAQVSMLLDDGRFDPAAIEVIKDSFLEMGQLSQRTTTEQLLTTRFVPVKP